MDKNFINIYNYLINYTRNEKLYSSLNRNDNFSDRLTLFLLHFAFFLKVFKNNDKKIIQEIYDFMFKQLELSIREIGYGDVTINKKMKDYVNLFHLIISKLENWDSINLNDKNKQINTLLNISNIVDLSVYFDKYSIELKNNTLNFYIKGVVKDKF